MIFKFLLILLVLFIIGLFVDLLYSIIFDKGLHFLFNTCTKQRVKINKTLEYLNSRKQDADWSYEDIDICIGLLEGKDVFNDKGEDK